MGMNLSVEIGKIRMKNPVTTGSGTFGSGQELSDFVDLNMVGAITVKGVSLEPWKGNPYPRTVETPAGMLNAIGLQNDGVDNFISQKLPFLRQFDTPVIVNVVGQSVEEYAEVARRLDKAEGVSGIELNVSCPNVKQGCMVFGTSVEGITEVVQAVRQATSLTLITKLSPNVTDITAMARAAVDAGTDALSLINTLLGTAIDPWTQTFRLANITGGLSGPAIKPVALRMVWQVAQAVDVPIIGMGGIVTGTDAVEFLLAGADAVAVGTGTFINPKAAVDVAEGIASYMEKMKIDDVRELVGSVKTL
ncbi:MAG TPA: dihydroorotate dehydrogenase [Armatimonadota bacterium]|nr:dihydroorotate dehydrogenase [Armatimonadota bacterium]HOM72844.1 dihydroorotate dehydrogenase [Armatimonadota bacterium]HOP79147.1 dihydroorotate dehydrogenase [Armatimonadota bacterium]